MVGVLSWCVILGAWVLVLRRLLRLLHPVPLRLVAVPLFSLLVSPSCEIDQVWWFDNDCYKIF